MIYCFYKIVYIPIMGYNMLRVHPGSFGERARSLSDLSACNTQAERIGSCFFYEGPVKTCDKFKNSFTGEIT